MAMETITSTPLEHVYDLSPQELCLQLLSMSRATHGSSHIKSTVSVPRFIEVGTPSLPLQPPEEEKEEEEEEKREIVKTSAEVPPYMRVSRPIESTGSVPRFIEVGTPSLLWQPLEEDEEDEEDEKREIVKTSAEVPPYMRVSRPIESTGSVPRFIEVDTPSLLWQPPEEEEEEEKPEIVKMMKSVKS
jgi:hypothetical protein